jgi:hopene-associated glycosyltransferase HpnB
MLALSLLSAAIWIYLLVARGGFWRCRERLAPLDPARQPPLAEWPTEWPSVVAIVPARDEAESIAETVTSLLRQRYPGAFRVVVVDDHSSDGTADAARAAAAAAGVEARLTVVPAPALPHGWTGKLWALKTGVMDVEARREHPDYLWLTDADIAYAPDVLERLVRKAASEGLTLASVMARLRCTSAAERAFIPAFVFFFQMLYPFRWVNDARRRLAAAAGGCMLVKRAALERAGGLDAIRSELIDDCALARRLKAEGPIWLGLAQSVRSLREYPRVADVRGMVARTAYCQLRYSPLLLALTVAAMTLTFLVPPVVALASTTEARYVALGTWALMALAFQPALRLFGIHPLLGAGLPAIALGFLVFTVDSCVQHRLARGGMWKGRAQAAHSDAR